MSKKVYKTSRKYSCPFCEAKLPRMELIDHVEKEHEALIPENYTAARVVYDSINHTDHGTCMICKKPVYTWNEKTSRYDNICSEKCRKEVRRIALERHIKVYNSPTLLTDPGHQEKMLANRHISGTYKHSDGASITYTGKYEKATLEFMDKVMNIPSKDIQMPGPILEYEYNGETHSWITDIYYIPANLIIEVKDGGNNPNNRNMPEYRGKQQAKEIMITELGKFNYLRLTNNNFSQLLEALAEIKYDNMDKRDATEVSMHYFINESSRLELINEAKSELNKNFKPKEKMNLSSLKKIHITESVIEKYKKEYPVLRHVRCKDTKEYKCDGYMWFDGDELACHVGSCEYLDDHTKWIVSLEILPKYKGHALSKQILDFAVKNMGCKYLSVNKNNKLAKYIYDEYGFKTYQDDKSMYYMTIDSKKLNESFIHESNNDGINTPKKLSDWMRKNISYNHTGTFLSPEEVEKNGYGDCHDQSYFEYKKLKEMGYPCGRLFMVEYSGWNSPGGATHTLCYYIDKGHYYWFENAWGNRAGIHGPYKSLEDLKKDVANKWPWSGNNDKLFMRPVGKVTPGMSLEDYVVACTPEKEPTPFATKDKKFDEVAIIHEEVGGLPPRRATSTWIEPYILDGHWDLSIGNDHSDTVLVKDTDGNIKGVIKKEYMKEYSRPGEALVYDGDDSTDIFNKLLKSQMSFTEALKTLAGYRFRTLDELALRPNWKYVNYKSIQEQNEFLSLGIIRENEILSGKVRVFENETPIKGAVILARSINGYFIHTPKDYYLSSNYYETPEDIPQNVIDTMADLYDQFKSDRLRRVEANG